MKIYLVRHAQSEDNLRTEIYGNSDADLTQLGSEQALKLGYLLPKFDMIFCSPSRRAIRTAEISTKTTSAKNNAIPWIILDDLRELDFGDFDPSQYTGTKITQIQLQKHVGLKDDLFKGHFGAETHLQFHQRANEVFQSIVSQSSANRLETVGIFSHAGVLKSITQYYLKLSTGGYENTEIALLTSNANDNSSWSLERIIP